MKCSEIEDQLEIYLAQKLDLQQRVAVESHLLSCTSCASKLADLSFVAELFDEYEEEALPPGLHEKIMKRIELVRAEASPTTMPANVVNLHQERALLYGDPVPQKMRRPAPLWMRWSAVASIVLLVTLTGLQLNKPLFNKQYLDAGASKAENMEATTLSADSYGRFAVGITPEIRLSRFNDLVSNDNDEAKQIQQFSISGVSSFLPQSEEIEPEKLEATLDSEESKQLENASLHDETASAGSVADDLTEASPIAIALMTPMLNAETGAIDTAQNEQMDSEKEAGGKQEALRYAGDPNASLPTLPALEMSEPEGEVDATVLSTASSDMMRQSSLADEPEVASETSPSVIGTEASYAFSGLPSAEAQNRSAEWRLSVKAEDIDPQLAITRAKELGCVNRYVGDSISFYGSNRALYQLVEEMGFREKLIWSEGVEQSIWSSSQQSEEEIWLQLVITIIK